MTKSFILYNPTSGQAQSKEYGQILKKRLEKLQHHVEILETKGSMDVVLGAQRSCEKEFDFLFVLGGDGTINNALKGLIGSKKRPILGILPMGTGNLIARRLKITSSIEELVENLCEEEYKEMDIGRVNNDVFAYMFSVGEIPQTIHETDEDSKEKLGKLAYLKELISKGNNFTKYPLKISWGEDFIEGNFSHIIVSTSTQYGSLKFSEGANRVDDGLLNFYLFNPMSNIEMLKLGFEALKGQVEQNKNVIFFTAKKIEIESSLSQIPTDIDGDKGPQLPVNIEILPNFVKVLAKE